MPLELAQTQRQTQALSARMIQSISVLAMPALELCEFIRDAAEQNPALEVAAEEPPPLPLRLKSQRTVRVARASASDAAESDAFQAFLESRPAPRPSVREHLLGQLALLPLNAAERALGERIVGNLDDRGFHYAPPEALLKPTSGETPEMLHKCLGAVRRLDPVGTACSGSAESLLVQAEIRGDAPPLARFLLGGRLGLLVPPRPQAVCKRLNTLAEKPPDVQGKITQAVVGAALEYIRSLEPFPAQAFGAGEAAYVTPDVFVSRASGDEADGSPSARFQVDFARDTLPRLEIAQGFSSLASDDGAKRFAKKYVADAQWVIDMVAQREQSIVKTVQAIVEAQLPFFERGPRFLRPLRLKDIAGKTGTSKSTVSRIANGKYLQCEWGLFEIRYFFSNQSSKPPVPNRQPVRLTAGTEDAVPSDAERIHSKESVKQELLLILKEHETARAAPRNQPVRGKREQAGKKLSDAALAQKLAERGIIIARRTVAKYRAELGITR